MLKITCNITTCKKELNEPSALVFSPPDKMNRIYKHHICKNCYETLLEKMVKSD